MDADRLERQIAFITEIDKLKQVLRRTYLIDGERRENSAEHSWHLAVMAVLLSEYAREELDLARVVKMLLLHDVVEIDAGDTFAYDEAAHADKEERERRAAERIFNLLPADMAGEAFALWEEFEAGATPEAKYAEALDRLQPILLNCGSGGIAWREHGISSEQVIARNRHIELGAPALWTYVRGLIDRAESGGTLRRERDPAGSERAATGRDRTEQT
ncbi:MAG: HD domain-containing protein [Gemmatimonadota bacterium]|nr:HD domain-containing protein [Gemmatimonadota bacterium]